MQRYSIAASFHHACVIALPGVQVAGCQRLLAHILLSKVVKPKLDPEGHVSHRNGKKKKRFLSGSGQFYFNHLCCFPSPINI